MRLEDLRSDLKSGPRSICQPGLQRSIPSNPNSNPSHWWVVDRPRLAKIRFICTNPLQPSGVQRKNMHHWTRVKFSISSVLKCCWNRQSEVKGHLPLLTWSKTPTFSFVVVDAFTSYRAIIKETTLPLKLTSTFENKKESCTFSKYQSQIHYVWPLLQSVMMELSTNRKFQWNLLEYFRVEGGIAVYCPAPVTVLSRIGRMGVAENFCHQKSCPGTKSTVFG